MIRYAISRAPLQEWYRTPREGRAEETWGSEAISDNELTGPHGTSLALSSRTHSVAARCANASSSNAVSSAWCAVLAALPRNRGSAPDPIPHAQGVNTARRYTAGWAPTRPSKARSERAVEPPGPASSPEASDSLPSVEQRAPKSRSDTAAQMNEVPPRHLKRSNGVTTGFRFPGTGQGHGRVAWVASS